MNRLLISVALACAIPGLAYSQAAAPAAKPAPAKKAAPAAKKAKPVVMTRDQLRTCLKAQVVNRDENSAIDAEKLAFDAERKSILVHKDTLQQQGQGLEALAKAITAENLALQEAAKEFQKPVPKEQLKEAEARRTAHNDSIAALQAKVATYNAQKEPFNKSKEQLDASIEANNSRARVMQARMEKYNVAVDDWKTDCGDKPYDVTDEAAVKKELGL